MACFGNYDYSGEKPNGECPDCGEPTIDGNAVESCSYSPQTCETCDCRPCDQSC